MKPVHTVACIAAGLAIVVSSGCDRDPRAQTERTAPEPQQAESDLRSEQRALASLIEYECKDVPVGDRSRCPFDRAAIESIDDIEEGVVIRIATLPGNEERLENRIDCYVANRNHGSAETARLVAGTVAPSSSDDPSACLLDDPDIEAEVESDTGIFAVRVTSDDLTGLASLRERASVMERETTAFSER